MSHDNSSVMKRSAILLIASFALVFGTIGTMIMLQDYSPEFLDSVMKGFNRYVLGLPPDNDDDWLVLVIVFGAVAALLYMVLVLPTWATSIKAREGIEPVSKDELRSRLLGLNDEKIPWQIVIDEKNPDKLTARWKVVDSKWLQIFSANRLSIYYELRMRLVDRGSKGKPYVKAQDYKRDISYSVGTDGINPYHLHIRHNFSFFRGIMPYYYQRGLHWGLIFKDGEYKVDYAYNFRFVASEIKNPIVTVIRESGWDFRPTMFFL